MWLLPGVQQLRALRMSHRLTCFTSLLALAVCFVCGFGFCGCFSCWVGFCLVLVSLVLHVLGDVLIFYPRVLDDRQCFTARSARCKKKKMLNSRMKPHSSSCPRSSACPVVVRSSLSYPRRYQIPFQPS